MPMPVTRIRAKFLALKPVMDERLTRLWAGAEAEAIGEGGITLVAAATGMSRTTIRAGRDELRRGVAARDVVKVRRAGAGRPAIEDKAPGIFDALESLLEPVARGDRESALRWTSKSTRRLSAELGRHGFSISPQKVAQLLHARGYRLQGMDRPIEGASHAQRDHQLDVVNARIREFHARGAPVIAVATRTQQLAPSVDDHGGGWERENAPVTAPDPRAGGEPGMSERAHGAGWDSVDGDLETPVFAVRAIASWWDHVARRACGDATALLVIAESGGATARARRWRAELQLLADRTGLAIGVSHLPLGTSRWTRVEHRLTCRATEGWCGRPAIDRQTVVQLIGGGPPRAAPTPTAPEPRGLPAEWNYVLPPRRDRS